MTTLYKIQIKTDWLKGREIELFKLGFVKNEHQLCYGMYKYDSSWIVDFRDIYESTNYDWNCHIENLKFELRETKKQYFKEVKESFTYNFSQKQFKKEIKDKYNHYNSKLKEATKTKLDRRDRTEYVIKLEAKVELLKSMMKYVDK